jgi:hypothetical protein
MESVMDQLADTPWASLLIYPYHRTGQEGLCPK